MVEQLPGPAEPQAQTPESLTHGDWGKTVNLTVNGETKTVTVEELTRAYQRVGGMDKLDAQVDSLRSQVAQLRSSEQQMEALGRLTQGGDPIETMNALIAQNASLQAQVQSGGSQPQGAGHNDPYGSGSDAQNVQAMLQQAIQGALVGPLTEIAQRQTQLESDYKQQAADTQRGLALEQLRAQYPNADMNAVQRHVDDLGLSAEKLDVAFKLAQAESGQPAVPAAPNASPAITMDVTTSSTPPGAEHAATPTMSVATPPGGLPPGAAPTAATIPDRSQFSDDTIGDAGYAHALLSAGGTIGSVADGLPID